MINKSMQGVYCYVDESGQHTQGAFFIIAIVIVNSVELRDSSDHMLLEMKRTTDNAISRFGINQLHVRSVVCRYNFIGIVLVVVGAILIFV